MESVDGRGDGNLRIQTPIELFDAFVQAGDLPEAISIFKQLCSSLEINPKNYKTLYQCLKNGLTSWKARSLWTKLDKRADHKDYKGKPCARNKVLVIGAGPCGLRVAIEASLLGAQVMVLEKRDRFSRNNVLHLWPFLITDLKDLGAKKFFGQFCAGSLDHISIKRLQRILLKVALIFGVQVFPKCTFVNLIEPKKGHGWKASIDPPSCPLNKFEFDIVIGADGKRQALKFKGKEFRGKLAIGITANFVNRNSKEEAHVEEISGVAFIFNQVFFQDLKDMTGIDLENIVYYKDETHYFVMCAKKRSLLAKGVIKKDVPDAYDLLHHKNVNHDKLLTYAREAAAFSTKFLMPHLDFAVNHQGKEDVAMFDFTSLFASECSIKIYERNGQRLLALIVGDSLLEPFWPTGSGCARGFLGCFDGAWAMRSFGLGKKPLDIITERENVYRILAQTTPENLNKNFQNYGICPDSRYTNLSKSAVKSATVKHLYDCHDGPIDSVDGVEPMDTSIALEPQPEVNISGVLKWCRQHTKGYKHVAINDMSSSWKDGLALCAIIHRFRPDLIDFNSLGPNDAEKNNQLAFQIAEEHLGIQPQVSAKEIACSTVPDQLTILSYVTLYYETFKNETPVTKTISREQSEKHEFRTKSPLSRLSIITRMTRKKEKRRNVRNNADVVSKKSKAENEENIHPIPKTPTTAPVQKPLPTGPVKNEDAAAKSKPSAKTSNKISLLAEQVFGTKDNTNVAVPNLPVLKDTGSDHCYFCNRFVYLMERMSAEGHFFHRECFKCEVCLNTLRVGAYSYIPPWETQDERGHFYCRLHYYKVINASSAEEKKLREDTETRSQKRKRRGRALTIGNARETIDAVHQAAAAVRKQKQSESQDDETPEVNGTPITNGLPEVDKNENLKKKGAKDAKNEGNKKPNIERKRSGSGRFRRLEARPLRRSSISSVRKSDKTVKTKGKGYKLDDDMLDTTPKSPIRTPSPSIPPTATNQSEHEASTPKDDKKSRKKLEKSNSTEEPIKGSIQPSGKDVPSVKNTRQSLDIGKLGTIERRRRQRRAMYPPLSQVFSPEDRSTENLETNLPLEEKLREAGMNIKVVDIDISCDGPKLEEPKETEKEPKLIPEKVSPKQEKKPPSPTSPTSVTKPPLTKRSSTGSMVSARAARIQGLMDNDLRPKKDHTRPSEEDQDEKDGPESPSEQRRSLPRLPSKEEPYVSTKESTKIIKRRNTPKPKADLSEIEREVNGHEDQEAEQMGFPVSAYDDTPTIYRNAPPKPPRSFKENERTTPLPQQVFSGSSEEEILDNEVRGSNFQRIGARRYKSKGNADLQDERLKRIEQGKIRIAMKQRHAKRLRRAQQIQRELEEVEVKQAEVEKDGVQVEKALRSGDLSTHEEQSYMMMWFQVINKKNALLRYESELSIHANSIQLEDQQGRLEQEIRELLMKENSSEEDQVIVQQKTKELVDIVEQRNCLVELLDEERIREQEEDRAFEDMIAAKGFVTSV